MKNNKFYVTATTILFVLILIQGHSYAIQPIPQDRLAQVYLDTANGNIRQYPYFSNTAAGNFAAAARLNPDNPAVYIQGGGNKMFRNDRDGACADFKRAKELGYPQYLQAARDFGFCPKW